MRPLLLLLLTSITLFGAGWEAALQRGLQAFGQGQCTTALQDLNTVIAQNQGIAQAHQAIAICETRLGQPDRATRSFQQVAQLRPHDWQAWNNLGANLIETGHPDKAVSAFEKATELNAGNELVWFNVGSTLLTLQKTTKRFRH